MSFIEDTFFGGAQKKAAKAQQRGTEKGIAATRAATRKAEEQALPLFGAAGQDIEQGFQGALNLFGRSIPEQGRAFQRGNLAAQQALLAGLPQQQAAILGAPVDLSGLQTSNHMPNFGFFHQQLPQTGSIFEQQKDGWQQQDYAALGSNPLTNPLLAGQSFNKFTGFGG